MQSRRWSAVDTISSIITIAAAALALWTLIRERPSPHAPPRTQPPSDLGAVIDIHRARTRLSSHWRGSSSAEVVLIEFADFQCSFCGRFTAETYPLIQSSYVDTGLVRYSFRHLPLNSHPLAFEAARAANCSGRQQ